MGIKETDKKIKININREQWGKLSIEDRAEICTMIVEQMSRKIDELSELFDQLRKTYATEVAVTGISLICVLGSEAFKEPASKVIMGTPKGIVKTFLPLAADVQNVLKEAAHDTETD